MLLCCELPTVWMLNVVTLGIILYEIWYSPTQVSMPPQPTFPGRPIQSCMYASFATVDWLWVERYSWRQSWLRQGFSVLEQY